MGLLLQIYISQTMKMAITALPGSIGQGSFQALNTRATTILANGLKIMTQ